MARRGGALVGVVALLVGVLAPSAAAGTPATGLPAPFRGWHVEVEPGKDAHVRYVTFDSAVLHRRATMRVVLPDLYDRTTAKLPVVYYLHGTTRIGTDPLVDAVFDGLGDAGLHVGYPFEEGGARNEAAYLAAEASRIRFVVVSPDAGTTTWCEHCAWVDGKGGQGVDAERHLYEEVLPLTEAMFRVRGDRAGRGIMGASMGAGGALTQATRHPDLYSVVAALSPPVDYLDDPPYTTFLWQLYLRQQGYPQPAVSEIATRAVNPVDLLPNLKGEGIDTIVTMGDGCLVAPDQGYCPGLGFAEQPINSMQEVLLRHNNDLHLPQAIADGVPLSYLTYSGVHFVVNGDVFRRHLLDRMNAVFARGAPTPARVAYRSAESHFSIWGWDAALTRRRQEFVSTNVRPDGTAFDIAGRGKLALTSPAAFAPGSRHVVTVTRTDGSSDPIRRELVADGQGRIAVQVDLGNRTSGRTTRVRIAP